MTRRSKKQGYLYGTVVLACAMVVVKLIGALFKIPLTNILGGVGMSYFNVAYDLYYPLYALFVSGLPIAVSKLVSENIAQRRYHNVKKILRLSSFVFVGVGLLGSVLMFAGAGWFSEVVKNQQAKLAVMMLAPALFFGCVMAALRGYTQGMQNMTPTAMSQVVEAACKMIFGLALAYGITSYGLRQFEESRRVFSITCDSLQQAQLAVLPFAAAGAIFGVTLSTLCGSVYLLLRQRIKGDGISKEMLKSSPPSDTSRHLTKKLLEISIPVCVASVITNLTSFIDLISVMNRLSAAIVASPQTILQMYAGAIPQGIDTSMLGSYLYGCYSGLAVPIYNLVPSLTTTISVSILPAVAGAWAAGNRKGLQDNVESSLRIASLIAFPVGIGIFSLSQPILSLLYFTKPMEVAVIAPALKIMGISAIFVALTLPINALLQAVGRADLPVKFLIIGGLIKLSLNYLLVAVPDINIQAAPIGTLVCYLFVMVAGLAVLIKTTGISFHFYRVIIKPLFGAVGCGLGAWAAYGLLSRAIDSKFSTLVAIGIGGIIFLIIILTSKTLTKMDVLMLPNGEKFAKILEKMNLIG
ncbi:putative polysaccharide biosynthesis protein [Youxingia wuxianensis]|uniref:Polysaccharide biosynthesis protein n=1 Tax=Youxingia wuxianensis TaxID=2763678 RepID=A0A926EMC2_9FIRM|nr:polysaccharide biosynthesis protein [Youxingia wuxianensis]MBC8585005.1 polysaccharide biosynthesis protein [Youxingia wuxianensis]